MPFVEGNEPLPEHMPIILLFGDPGVRKTSIANTSNQPLLLDFDKGVHRSHGRKTTLIPKNWEEVQDEEKKGSFSRFKTIIIDTAKACLDDYLTHYVIRQDFKLKRDKRAMFGEIGSEFKAFVDNRRNEGYEALIIIAHAKTEDKPNRVVPDVTGGSYSLLLRIADQVGYVTTINNDVTICWDPKDDRIGKNTAGLPDTPVPHKNDPAFNTFMADIISKVKEIISTMSEEQREALEKSVMFQEQIAECDNWDDAEGLISVVNELPPYLSLPLNKAIADKLALIIDAIETPETLNDIVSKAKTLPEEHKPIRFVIADRAKKLGFILDKATGTYSAPAAGNKGNSQSQEMFNQGGK